MASAKATVGASARWLIEASELTLSRLPQRRLHSGAGDDERVPMLPPRLKGVHRQGSDAATRGRGDAATGRRGGAGAGGGGFQRPRGFRVWEVVRYNPDPIHP